MRSKPAIIRTLTADPVYGDVMVTKLINRILLNGEKSVATRLVYSALESIKQTTQKDPLQVFSLALENIRPQMEVKARRIGGAAYQVPTPVRGPRKDSLAIRWLVSSARLRPSSQYHTFAEKLAAEILDASNQAGGAVKKKLDTHRMAEANKAFAHFRW
jgi:small subunit ribosomal protein S7